MFCETGVDVTGEVTEAGPEVADFKKGDKVIAMLSLPVSIPCNKFLLRFMHIHWRGLSKSRDKTFKDSANSHIPVKINYYNNSTKRNPVLLLLRVHDHFIIC